MVLLLLKKQDFFVQETPAAGIYELIMVYGYQHVVRGATLLGKTLSVSIDPQLEDALNKSSKRKKTERGAIRDMRPADSLFSTKSFDLLASLLRLLPLDRYSAQMALSHSFFSMDESS